MLTILFGFATSLVYGFADFFGALASKKISATLVTFLAGLSGLVFLLLLTPLLGANNDSQAITWGVWAGLSSALAMTCLYASLAIGPISILSPLGAVVSAIVPAIFSFIHGERFSTPGLVALLFILIAVVLVGFVPSSKSEVVQAKRPSPRGLILASAAGAGIGGVLICLDQAPGDSGLTAVVWLRAVSASSLGLMLLAAVLRKRILKNRQPQEFTDQSPTRLGLPAVALVFTALAGVLDASANALFLTASRTGSLTVVSVLTALYPLGTIILARVFLKERIAKVQMVGVILALGASALLVVS